MGMEWPGGSCWENETVPFPEIQTHPWATRNLPPASRVQTDPGWDQVGHVPVGIDAVLSRFSCVRLSVTPWTVAHQAPLSTGFSRQEYWHALFQGIFPPRDQTCLSCVIFSPSTTWEALADSNTKARGEENEEGKDR